MRREWCLIVTVGVLWGTVTSEYIDLSIVLQKENEASNNNVAPSAPSAVAAPAAAKGTVKYVIN